MPAAVTAWRYTLSLASARRASAHRSRSNRVWSEYSPRRPWERARSSRPGRLVADGDKDLSGRIKAFLSVLTLVYFYAGYRTRALRRLRSLSTTESQTTSIFGWAATRPYHLFAPKSVAPVNATVTLLARLANTTLLPKPCCRRRLRQPPCLGKSRRKVAHPETPCP